MADTQRLAKAILETTEALVVVLDPQGRVAYFNRACESLTGYSRGEVIGKALWDILLPERYVAPVKEVFNALRAGGQKLGRRYENPWLTKDGRERLIAWSSNVATDAAGAVTHIIDTGLDITELMEAQKRLSQSEQLYREVVGLTDAAVVRFDLEGRCTFVNEAFVWRYGKPAEELLKGAVGDQMVPEDAEKDLRLFRQCISTGVPVRGLVSRHVEEGRTLYTRGNLTPIRDAAGKVVGAQVTSVDITDMVEAQERLQRSEELYRSVVDLTDATIARFDREGRRTFANEGLVRRLGVPADQLLKGKLGDVLPPGEAGKAWRAFRHCLETESPVRGLVEQVRGRGGHAIYVRTDLTPLRDAKGNVTGVQVTSFDITELLEAQERVRRSEELHRSLMNAVPVAVVRVDKEGRRTFVSAYATETNGRSAEELLLGRFGDFMAPEDREKALAHLAQVFHTGEPVRAFVNRQTLKGEERRLSTNMEPIKGPNGDVVEVQVSSVDITDLRRLQDQYYQAQKMESVGRLAGGVAHDFNNLLTAILGYSELGIGALPEDNPVREYLEEIQRTGERAAMLTRQLLTFSRRQVIQPRVLNPNELIQNMDRMLRRLIGEDVEVVMSLAPDLWQVRADPGLLEQVLVNLAVNARDAMPRGGRLTIETRNIASAQQHDLPAGEYVALAVSDTGSGMTEEARQHAFEPFFTTKPQGTGLGLATCHGIVKQSGGDIQLQSEAGKGTTVTVHLPRALEEAPAPRGGDDPTGLPRGVETVLLVEDDSSVRRLVARVLSGLGYSVLEATNGAEALRMAQEDPDVRVHLLLTDVVMPGMSGKELAEGLRALRPRLKALFISGYTEDSISLQGVLEPGTELLRKPFSAEELARKVRQVLDS